MDADTRYFLERHLSIMKAFFDRLGSGKAGDSPARALGDFELDRLRLRIELLERRLTRLETDHPDARKA